ncbi:hypothetical protein NBRC3222_1354 [Acetobacter pasteurianus NBRC 3222]|nr:hypothetical protein NBRC3222_1354 [Acetobacter pasteurianus NBRC 3222]
MDDPAKTVGGLAAFEQRRAGKGDEGGIGQRMLHAGMVFTALTAMAFIHQHNDVRAVIMTFGIAGGSVELVDEREDDPLLPMPDLLGQTAA